MANSKTDNPTDPSRPSRSTGRKHRKNSNSRNGRARAKPTESQLSVIERLLRAPVVVTRDGQSEKMSTLQAIMFQLLQKALAGDGKAERVSQKFEEFARRNSIAELELVFVDNDYTTAFSATGEPDDV
jgi:hypothetical protein